MLVDDLIEKLDPYRGRCLNIVIIDEDATVLSDIPDIAVTSEYVLEYADGRKCVSAIILDGTKVVDSAISIIAKGYYHND